MTASPLSSALPPIDPTGTIGGGAAAPEAKGADGKAAANGGMPFDDVLRQLAVMLTQGPAEAPALGSTGHAHGAAKAEPAEIAIAQEPAPDSAKTDVVLPVVVPVPFLPTAAMPTPLVAIPHQAFEPGRTPAAEISVHIEAPSDAVAKPVPELAVSDGCEAAIMPIRLTLARTPVDTCAAPETPSVAMSDDDPQTGSDAVAHGLEIVKRVVPAHDQAAPLTTMPTGRADDGAAWPRVASASPAIEELTSQLSARLDDTRQQRDGPRDESSKRGHARAAQPAMTNDDRAATPALAATAPAHVSVTAPQLPTHSAAAAAPTADAPVEPATSHASAAPAFAAHLAFESPVSGPRLTMAPGFAAHLDAAPAVMDRELPGQIVQAIRMQFAEGGGDAVVRLQPHFLGEVVIAIRVEQGVVTAALQSDTPAVRQWIETHEGSLRTALADQGLQLDRLVVTGEAKTQDGEDTARRQPGDPESPEERQRRSRRRKNDPDDQGTFEVFA